MTSLGSLGTTRTPAPDPEPVTFDWFGTPIGVVLEYNQVELLDLMESMGDMDEKDPRAMVVAKDMLRLVVQPDARFRPPEEGEGDADILVHAGFDRFWALAKENWQTIEDLGKLSQTLMEASTDRPTQRPSDSQGGRPAIEGNSQVVSDLPVRTGRPDLQVLREDAERDRLLVEARLTLRDICDTAYVILLDDATARARMVWQAQVARGVDVKDLSDPDQAIADFHTRLRQPLDTERRRAAALRLIRGA